MEKLDFDKIKIITTRAPRINEKNNDDKIFVNRSELQKLIDRGEIAYYFDMLGNTYAYSKTALFTNKNTVFEMHYWTIKDLKKICPNLCAIYLKPTDINIAKDKLRQRHLSPDVENARLNEIDEHYNKIMNSNLLEQFDYVLYNNYDKESEDKIINLVKELVEK
jgi:guanylate kinase